MDVITERVEREDRMTTFLHWAIYPSVAWVTVSTCGALRAIRKSRDRRFRWYAGTVVIGAWFVTILILAAGDLR